MRMFLSVSGHSSELSIANHSPQSTVSQLHVSPTLYQADLRITNRRRQKSPPSFTLLSFKNLNWMTSSVDRNPKFCERIFSLLQYSRQLPSFPGHRAAMMTKPVATFSSAFVSFAIQFCFRCKFSFHEKRRSSQVWHWRDFLGSITILLLRITTNEIASFV